ncbi:MAG: hypothetical protein WCS73_03290 [Lentisphaeria bacterium]
MKWFTDTFYQKIVAEDMPLLADLDRNGIMCGDDEDTTAFAARLSMLQKNMDKMEASLASAGFYEISGIKLCKKDRISEAIFKESQTLTKNLYDFKIKWIPGFFLNHGMGFLFGGCAFSFYPDFFALFIIRNSFRKKRRWLCYCREELLAHELCHIARMSLKADTYEEMFAYQTATSSFRKIIGGIFRSPIDSFAFLGVTLLLLLSQILRTFWLPGLPAWPFWGLLGGTLLWQTARHIHRSHLFWRAVRILGKGFGRHYSMPVAFRCSDSDINRLASLQSGSELKKWLSDRCRDSLRWRVVCYRYLDEGSKS